MPDEALSTPDPLGPTAAPTPDSGASQSDTYGQHPDGAEFQVIGTGGPAVLLLPGGAESVDGFFPGLVEGLTAVPGCRVILHDRPGTGANTTAGTLAGASDALHAALRRHEIGPVVVIGQSLGGAVAALLAHDHPEDVIGLVLLDPSAVNDVAFAKKTEQGVRRLAKLSRIPIVRGLIAAQLTSIGRRMAKDHGLRPEIRLALFKNATADLGMTSRAAAGLADIAATFDETRLPRVPAAVVTADREPGAPIRQAHARLATALDVPLLQWPDSTHSVHLTHPDEVLDTCRIVIRDAAAFMEDRANNG
ncbi:alpha/beta fold hydrolase [Saccharopolyspora spinosa]|uniref:Pimeloyl-ACP methyl ester carboxylesterase n=1 Tax=Saccharopolyspora spinosa TaxID=60894 RepID=A0A2N3Y010_SACSN|nr:alpha/beta hydrolase [Saccharopolyspora spinosa]PKW16252.1 pimeloyl-ACP methyl ester carboxylesterase [Saccharopolyspora spinosa]